MKTPLNILVRTTKSYWEDIVNYKHPVMKNKVNLVINTLKDPLMIRKSKNDSSVFLYYSSENTHYICVVVKHLNGNGFIITCYRTDKIKIGEKIWPL